MKKGLKITAVFLCLLGVALLFAGGEKPYQDLDAARIASAKVLVAPPDTAVEIADTRELAQYLRDIVIYDRERSFEGSACCGQSCVFTLTMTDGTQTEITESYPFLVIDGTAYKVKYEPCEALNRYANGLLESGSANVILEEPPCMAVKSDRTSSEAVLGTYSWQKKAADGTSFVALADCAQLPGRGDLPPFETSEATAELWFKEAPDRISSARCWCAEEDAADSEAVPVRGSTLTLKPGGYIYEITAEWDAGNGYGGTASYFIYIMRTE